jgi:glycine oxidase
MYEKTVDFIISGMGLAGTTLSHILLSKGYSLLAFDHPDASSSSRVAAGLYNPVTGGRQMKKSWKAESLFPFLYQFYRNVERQTGKSFLYDIPIYRPFLNRQEANDFDGYSSDTAVSQFVTSISHEKSEPDFIKDPYGGVYLQQTGYLDVPVYLDASHDWFEKNGLIFKREKFDTEKIQPGHETITYETYKASKLILCQGHSLKNDRFFHWLPWSAVKGEVLEIKSDIFLNKIYNRGCFIIPGKGDIYRLGATYDWKNIDTHCTQKGKDEILGKLASLMNVNVEVIGHKAGIRPATRDRKPFSGLHPQYNNIGVFGGLGSKGVSLAPYLADKFAKFLTKGDFLNREVNIERYYSLY